ncbi:restriction endonuclease subunit S [Pseudoalteromonas sp. OFAV1]|uniref:restriction endonuclease subunit S n=1 Tax=Pseudoalteromonas sp. OFAV1 TaxID=2908892 RepID=UPI001F3A6550|nr:restriction endonuclease subunit S [Pseudoalteromonas sp. OFAV1]MCF2901862.1 restriction endonuclease subunit S [Pseudoalteromonas sp. OFAV1]
MIRLKEVAVINSTTPSSLIGEYVDYLPMQEVTETGKYTTKKQKKGQLPSGLNNFQQGDYLLAKISPCFENGKGALISSLETGFGMGSSELMPIKPVSINPEFLGYLLSSPEFINAGIHDYKGATGHQRVSPRFVGEFVFDESIDQERVVSLLNEKTKSINSQITSLTQKLHHLEEYKTALIHNAVTKGLDANNKRILDGTPAEEMTWKDSGVEWMGDIPDGWGMSKIKNMFNVIGGYAAPNDIDMKENKNGISFYRMAFMGKNSFTLNMPKSDELLTEDQAKFLGFSKVKAGSILIPKSGSVYKNHRCLVNEDCYIVSHIMALSPSKDLSSEYFTFLLKILDMAKDMTKTTGLDSIGQDDVKNFEICNPSKHEQIAISDYLLVKTSLIGEMKSEINKKIALLVEYKKSLINEAVSGGVNV